MRSTILVLIATLSLSACATRGQNYVPVVDMRGQNHNAFVQDLSDCQAYARQRPDGAQGAVAGAIVGGLLGAVIAPRHHRNTFGAYGAGLGAAAGAGGAMDTQESIVKRCMAGRGYNVLN
jgi:outer membrane lipoprotein SlyB